MPRPVAARKPARRAAFTYEEPYEESYEKPSAEPYEHEQPYGATADAVALPRRSRTRTVPSGEQHQQAADEHGRERTPTGGLPRRVRQASLAPQLREPTPARPRPVAEPADPTADRCAEEVRARMAALQRGWQRGREDNELTIPSSSPSPSSTTAPGTTTEGDGR